MDVQEQGAVTLYDKGQGFVIRHNEVV
jgi:hypothetical protein